MLRIPTMHQTDAYKIFHRVMMPDNTNLIYSNLTPRKSRIAHIDKMVFFGLQYFIKDFLMKEFDHEFFLRPKSMVLTKYKRRLDNYFGGNNSVDHVGALHDLGYLPIHIKALPEGTLVPMKTPALTIHNTHPDFSWLTNYLETIMSCYTWFMCNCATNSKMFRDVFDEYSTLTCDNNDFVVYQGHDFSFRGMPGKEAACMEGAAHLLSFVGTDTIPAIDFIEEYYNADSDKELIGCSIPATEHSVASMNSIDSNGEHKYVQHLLNKFPSGLLGCVADTYDYYNFITSVLQTFKSEIMNRDGKFVVRPDSSPKTPVEIICGDPDGTCEVERKGSIQLLWELFGGTTNTKGYKELDPHIGLIYGDAISLERQKLILENLKNKGFASNNIVLGIGSFAALNQHGVTSTRDTYGIAVKCTYGEVDNEEREVYKDPITDKNKGMKKSARGLIRVNEDLTYTDQVTWDEFNSGMLEDVFVDGQLLKKQSFTEIRSKIYA